MRELKILMGADENLEVLAVTLVDLRSTIENQHRAIRNAQASIEQFRHTRRVDALNDIRSCLHQLRKDATAISEAATFGETALGRLQGDSPGAADD